MLSVLDLLDETEDRRKHLPHHRLPAVAVRGGIRTQTPITDGGGAPGPFSLMVINGQGWAGLGLDRRGRAKLCAMPACMGE